MINIPPIWKTVYEIIAKSIRNKLAMAFILIELLMIFVAVYSNLNLNFLLKQYDQSLSNYALLNEFFVNNNEIQLLLQNYFVTKSQEVYDKYEKGNKKAFDLLKTFDQYVNDDFSHGKVYDLERMMQSYNESAKVVVQNLNNMDSSIAYKALNEAGRLNKLIDTRFRAYFNILFSISDKQRNELFTRKNQQILINFVVIAFSIVFCTIFIYLLSKGITKPIGGLVKNAKQISNGNFNVSPLNLKSMDEMRILSNVFNKMVESIKYYISEMENKATLQEKLYEEENKNLMMGKLLSEAQLKALQAQINPHFLFNTLNIINQKAYIEGADETRELLEATSDLLRYNLERADHAVSLLDEIACMENYIYIQKIRFDDRITFSIEIDDNLEGISVPGLIIQPLIENAIIHGLDEFLKNGHITIRINRLSNKIIIEVEDNGVGMGENIINDILDKSEKISPFNEKKIGILNVKKRLELFFNYNNVMHITSIVGKGTVVRLMIPI